MQSGVWAFGLIWMIGAVQVSCSTDTTDSPSDGNRGSVVSHGVISSVDGITVNGVKFDTSRAEIIVNGSSTDRTALQPGMVVRVAGDESDDSRSASRIEHDRDLHGPISSVDGVNRRFTVLGRTVAVLPDTGIRGGDFDSLAMNDRVAVSGFTDADGVLRARFIDEDGEGGLELEGEISNLSTLDRSFFIGSQRVDYSAAALRGFPAGGIAVGQWVEVLGNSVDGGVLRATSLRYESGVLASGNGQAVDLEGLVQRLESGSSFRVERQLVRVNSSTRYLPNGTSFASLATNSRVFVSGRTDTDGAVLASRIELAPHTDAEVFGQVDSVDGSDDSLVVLGRTLATTARTVFDDQSNGALRPFGLGDVRNGDWVRVAGYVESDGDYIATRLERRDAPARLRVEGPATVESANQTLRVAGVRVETNNQTEFRDGNGAGVSRDQFFSQLATSPSLRVRAAGGRSGSSIVAAVAELRN